MRSSRWSAAARPLLLVCAAWVVIGSSGCAIFESKNRLLLNKLDEHIQPASIPARAALAPIAIPAGALALATDAVIVHPVAVVPKAWDDVYQLYWKPREMEPLRRALLFGPIVILTPPTFVGDWLMRSMFDIGGSE